MEQPKILVAIRKRPLNKKQQARGDSDIISVKNGQAVTVSEYKQKVDLTKYLEETVFNFDFAYDQQNTNEEIYNSAVRPLVDSAFQGAKVTCFAYGQTGSGKTFTMNGLPSKGVIGLYTLGAQDIFAYLADSRFSHLKARLSFFQIYCGKLFDLLNKRQQLKMREDNKANINIIGLQETLITSWEQFIQLLEYGTTQRVTSQNSANADSSRSHAILQISLKDGKKLFGKISFIDLAGNERGADHMDMSKQTRIDGAQINKSLLSLKECIRALDQGKGHTPFRGSKLTMVLKDSFVGFCRTVMIGNISPASNSSQNTLNTLRYADRVKELRKPQNGPVSKEDIKARQLMLPRQNNKNVLKINIDKDDDAQDIQKKRQNAQRSFRVIEERQIGQQLHTNSLGHGVTNMKRQGSNGNFNGSNNNTQQVQNQLPIPSKQLNQIGNSLGSNYPVKINSTNSRKVPSTGTNPPSQRGQLPGTLQYGYSNDDSNMMAPQTIYRNNSMQVNSNNLTNNISLLGRNNNLNGNRQGASMRMDVENQTRNQSQTNNYFKPINGGLTPNNPVVSFRLDVKPRQGMGTEMEPDSPLKFKNNLNNRAQKQSPAYQQKSNFSTIQTVPPLFSQKSNNTVSPENEYDIPNNWQQSIDMIMTTQNPDLMLKLQESISENLIIEESNLMQKHSNTLRKEIDTIKEEMSLISKVQHDKNSISTREYVAFLQDSIQQKLSSLQLLREHLAQFSYKLDQVQEIEQKIKTVLGDGVNFDDQQLLDDLH